MKENTRAASYALIFPFALFLFWQGESCQNKGKSDSSVNRKSEVVTVTTNQNESREASKQGDKRAAAAASPDGDAGNIAKGMWGGTHISLTMAADGSAEVEYDCAHGRIEKITPAADGSFEARGTHVTERGGPIREGEESDGQPARYSGQVTGKTMTLKVTLAGSGKSVGTFTLVHGQTPQLTKCL